jgi:hypothetical protein
MKPVLCSGWAGAIITSMGVADMTTGTINELYTYRMGLIIKNVLKNNHLNPKTSDELFDFLEGPGAKEFANAVISDMIVWQDDTEWLDAVKI